MIGRWQPAVFVAIVMLGELGLFLSVTTIVDRARPHVTHLDGQLPTSSFPSGHTAATLCLYGALAILVVPRTRGPRRWLALGGAVLMPALVAWSRMYRGEHHPLDLAGGVVLALLWLAAVTLILRPNANLEEPDPSLGPLTSPSPASAPSSPAIPLSPATRGARQAGSPRDQVRDTGRRPAVVANPIKVRNGGPRHTQIQAALASACWPKPLWLETTREDPGGGQTRHAVQSGADVVLACGGDGTVTACASELAGTDMALAVVPSGTGNLLAANLKLPARAADAVTVATGCHQRRLDVGRVEGRYFTVMQAWGSTRRCSATPPIHSRPSSGGRPT